MTLSASILTLAVLLQLGDVSGPATCPANAGAATRPAIPWVSTRPESTQRKKSNWPTMPDEAKAAMDAFRKAVSEGNRDKALSRCTQATRARASRYGSEFIQLFVPIKELLAQNTYRFWTYGQDKLGGECVYFGCFLSLGKQDGETVNWDWSLEKKGDHWLVDLPDVPVEAWAAEEVARQKRLKERADAKWKALEPKLKGLRTQLTASEQEYRLGQPMKFRLELVNEGKHELSYDKQQVAVNASMLITSDNGQVIPYTAGPHQTGGAAVPIRPGETAVLFESLDIAEQYDMTKPGKYRVQFTGRGLMVADAIGAIGLHGAVARQTFPSNVVEIDVKP